MFKPGHIYILISIQLLSITAMTSIFIVLIYSFFVYYSYLVFHKVRHYDLFYLFIYLFIYLPIIFRTTTCKQVLLFAGDLSLYNHCRHFRIMTCTALQDWIKTMLPNVTYEHLNN